MCLNPAVGGAPGEFARGPNHWSSPKVYGLNAVSIGDIQTVICISIGPAQWPQLAGSDENGHVRMRRPRKRVRVCQQVADPWLAKIARNAGCQMSGGWR